MFHDAPAPDLAAVSDLRDWCHEQGWSAMDVMLICLCLATEAAAALYVPDDELESVH